jgi:hypothetical protein
MPSSEEMSSEEMLQHLYHDRLQQLKLNQAQTEALGAELVGLGAELVDSRRILLEQYKAMIGEVIESLTIEKPDPELVLQRGLKALYRIEQFRFLLGNLLEAVKRDESLKNSLIHYKSLGLTDFTPPQSFTQEEEKKSPWPSNAGAGRFLRKLWEQLRKAALTIMEIVLNAIKLVPKLVSIKPQPSIGLSGPFPTFSLEFDLEAEAITIHEFFHDLTEGLSAP